MEAIRRLVTPKSRKIQITIPENLVHEKLEIIILSPDTSDKKKSTAYKSLKGRLIKEDVAKMISQIDKSREEWT